MALEGAKDKVAGKAREIKGKVTGDEAEESAGRTQQLKGDAVGTANKGKRKIEGKGEELKGKIKQHIP